MSNEHSTLSLKLVVTIAALLTLILAAPGSASAHRSWAFSLDCNSSGDNPPDSSAQTKDTLTAEFYSDGEYLGYASITPSNDTSLSGGDIFSSGNCTSFTDLGFIVHFGSDETVDEVRLYTDGTNALWIDESFLWSSTDDNAGYDDSWTKKVEHWGRDNSNGWCLSQQEDDWESSNWKNHVSAEACSGCIKFSVSDGSAYFCSGSPEHTNED